MALLPPNPGAASVDGQHPSYRMWFHPTRNHVRSMNTKIKSESLKCTPWIKLNMNKTKTKKTLRSMLRTSQVL